MSLIVKEMPGGVTVLELSGRLFGGAESEEIHRSVLDNLDEDRRSFVFDLAEVPWVNSSGITVILAAFTAIKGQNGRLVLSRVNDRIMGILKMMRLDTVIPIYSEQDEAVRSFGS